MTKTLQRNVILPRPVYETIDAWVDAEETARQQATFLRSMRQVTPMRGVGAKEKISHADYCEDAKPHLQWKHVDGPLLVCHDGSMHWLTWWERICIYFEWKTVEELDKKYCGYCRVQ